MNEQNLIAEIRSSLQAQVSKQVVKTDGSIQTTVEFIITDDKRRQELSNKLADLLLSIEPTI